MDSLIRTAARTLEAGDPFGALNWVALRGDAPALALRGRFEGLRLPGLATLFGRKYSCEVQRVPPSVRKRPWPARGVLLPRLRSHLPRAN